MKYVVTAEEARAINQRWKSENQSTHPMVLGWNQLAQTQPEDSTLWEDVAFGCAVDQDKVSESKSYAEKDDGRWKRLHSVSTTSCAELIAFASKDTHGALAKHAEQEWARLLTKNVLDSLLIQRRFEEARMWGEWCQKEGHVSAANNALRVGVGIRGFLSQCEVWDEDTRRKAEQVLESWVDFEDTRAILSEIENRNSHVNPKGVNGCEWLYQRKLFGPETAVRKLFGVLYDLNPVVLTWLVKRHPFAKTEWLEEFKKRTEFESLGSSVGKSVMNQLWWGLMQSETAPWAGNKEREKNIGKAIENVLEWMDYPALPFEKLMEIPSGKAKENEQRRLVFLARHLFPYARPESNQLMNQSVEASAFLAKMEAYVLRQRHVETTKNEGVKSGKHAL